MAKEEDTKSKKKGFFALIKESMSKISSGCGPGCGCHVEEKEADSVKRPPEDSKK